MMKIMPFCCADAVAVSRDLPRSFRALFVTWQTRNPNIPNQAGAAARCGMHFAVGAGINLKPRCLARLLAASRLLQRHIIAYIDF